MNKYYITFGQSHVHRVNDITFDCDSVACIRAVDEGAARAIAFDLFGSKWFTSYTEETINLKYFPRGVFNVN